MIDKKWKEFRETGLLLFVNRILRVFGWSIVIVTYNEAVIDVYPARVKFRFNTDIDKRQVAQYLKDDIDELMTKYELINMTEDNEQDRKWRISWEQYEMK